ncbi:hypothetical protein LVD15_24910 [Fulvivirga maritima]|uniref:DUF6892 domain-containing protein n=1 Tax=Fulvivirga maritima TaxID=2904247 RepID=UPI001F3A04DB|nr:hypothetical protein [Fulvivirga maritima]UII26498.1 hypothetical protein LVD15_24910 [Fulvivirga maritima]
MKSALEEQAKTIAQAKFNDKSSIDKIHREWSENLKHDPAFMNYPLAHLAQLLTEFPSQTEDQRQATFKYAHVLASFSPQYGLLPKTTNSQQQYHDELNGHISQLLQREDYQILETESLAYKGTLGAFIATILRIYVTLTQINNPLRDQASVHLLPLIKKFDVDDSYLLTLYGESTDTINALSELLCHYIATKNKEGVYFSILYDMLGEYAKREDFAHKSAPKIIEQVLKNYPEWNEDDIKFLIHEGVIAALGIKLETKEEQLAKINDRIAFLKTKNLGQGIKHYKKERADLEQNFDSIQSKKWNSAVRSIAVKKPLRQSLELLLKKLPESAYLTELAQLVTESHEFKNKPKVFPINKSPKVKFKDFGFKLWVIEELMYNQEVLQPKFDIYEFAKEYDKRQIDVESDGYDLIPEAKKYLQQLDMSEELLKQVTTLEIDDGINGGSEVYNQLWPFYDPGTGDELIKVSNKAIDDLSLLPNLKKIIGLEMCNPTKKLLKYMEEQGITLESIEH